MKIKTTSPKTYAIIAKKKIDLPYDLEVVVMGFWVPVFVNLNFDLKVRAAGKSIPNFSKSRTYYPNQAATNTPPHMV